MRSDTGAAFFERQFLPLVFQTHLSSVVVEELYAGALDAQAVGLVESSRAPTYAQRDQPKVQSSTDLKRYPAGLCARRIGADLFTFNREDFQLIQHYRPFSLKVLVS
jgi:hypothetical protein